MTNINASNISPFAFLQGVNIFLIGFMGSGKSYWGEKWAKSNQLTFIDLDEIIENKEGQSIASIFESKGEEYFRKQEATALRSCAGLKNTIIACGGGTPCFYENMLWMNDNGITVYIVSTSEEILHRVLKEKEKRPLLKDLSEQELLLYIKQKIKERAPFYEMAKITVQSDLLGEQSLADLISTTTI